MKYRQSYRLERYQWPWEAKVYFNSAVTVEVYEEYLAANPIFLAKVDGTLQQVIIEMEDASYEHPLQQEPERGTRAVFRFLARINPI